MDPQPLLFADPPPAPQGMRLAVAQAHFADERRLVAELAQQARFDEQQRQHIETWGKALIARVRQQPHPLDAFLHEYDLGSEEGVLLMCLAEGLIRIPDATTADRLIQEKLGGARWDEHLGNGRGLLVNASAWSLMLAGRIVGLAPDLEPEPASLLQRLVARSGEPLVRNALRSAMHLLARQFVMGRTIDEALARAARHADYRHSFDMLGEAAMSSADAERYAAAYRAAIAAIGKAADSAGELMSRPGLSIKLSALHPRYETAQRARVLTELVPRLTALLEQARDAGIPVTLDAEEARRLELSLDIFEAAATRSGLRDWPGFGVAVQAYQKRAPAVIDWLAELAAAHGAPIAVRLVKGAYWDSEIKAAQQQGLPGYPVFTDKTHTDLAYLACARRLLGHDRLFPQFASHNAHTVAAVRALAADAPFEYQRLHGMGQALYDEVVQQWQLPCRVYAPVGGHRELLPYLVRRLLENGANTSFVNRIVDQDLAPEQLLADPAATVAGRVWEPPLPLPAALYEGRTNSAGTCLDDPLELAELERSLREATATKWQAGATSDAPQPRYCPADRRIVIGHLHPPTLEQTAAALERAAAAWPDWSRRPLAERCAVIRRAGDLLEQRRHALAARIVMEGGRTVADALAEVREAVDFCRYYPQQAERLLSTQTLPGPTGEENLLTGEGRGLFLCISPWNFPVSIFTGQAVAALLAGNAVLAKPAHQTPLCAAAVVDLLHEAGVPADVVQLLPVPGTVVDGQILAAPALAGVAFTGSVATAHHLQQRLAQRPGPILPLIAETGGQNAMIVDSSALPEQAAADIVRSAFDSAGQRCSALRMVWVQEEAAQRLIEVLAGTMGELQVGDPRRLATDVGPLIDAEAREKLEAHCAALERSGARLLARTPLPEGCDHGDYLAPCLYEVDDLELLREEHFGPVLHLLRYRAGAIDEVIDRINELGFGLTLGIHSRVEAFGRYVAARVRAGNVYINRDMIGAAVGTQPFGGRGLSGTGFKAGGPHYLLRFATEKTVTTNTAAIGGNAALLGGGR